MTPFFIGTYFPRESRYGLPGLGDLLTRVAEVFATRRGELRTQAASLREILSNVETPVTHRGALDLAPVDSGLQQLLQQADADNGGFGGAPKFPHPHRLNAMLHLREACDADSRARVDAVLCGALDAMQNGGLQDQLGGGFFRYCVDADWRIPHFEKMLYDNAALLTVYSDAARAFGRHDYAHTARLCADFLLREMLSPEGGFYAALDADSDRGEGDYYVWTADQVRAVLPPEQHALALQAYGFHTPANFESRWHLQRRLPCTELEQACGIPGKMIPPLLEILRGTLLAQRLSRPYPHRDEKQLCAWNGLAISGLVAAWRALREERYLHAAQQCAAFIQAQLWSAGGLLASRSQGHSEFAAYLDDHAFLLQGLWDLFCAQPDPALWDFMQHLLQRLLQDFVDQEYGGFYFTARGHEALLCRSRSGADEAMASGAATAAFCLQRIALLSAQSELADLAERAIRAQWEELQTQASSHCTLLRALDDWGAAPQLIVVVGDEISLQAFKQQLQGYAPKRVVICARPEQLPLVLRERYPAPNQGALAWFCDGQQCHAAVGDLADLQALLMR